MAGTLDIETGIPVEDAALPGLDIQHDRLPAGPYARRIHTGPYDDLLTANAALIRWGEEKGIPWAMQHTDRGQVFDCRLEIFRTGPDAEPDPAKWVTEIAILLTDGR